MPIPQEAISQEAISQSFLYVFEHFGAYKFKLLTW